MRKIFSKKFWKEIIVFSKYRYITKWKYRFRDMDSSWNNVNFTRNCYCFSFSVYRQYIRWNVSNWNFFFFFFKFVLNVGRISIPQYTNIAREIDTISTRHFYEIILHVCALRFFLFFFSFSIHWIPLFFVIYFIYIWKKRRNFITRAVESVRKYSNN